MTEYFPPTVNCMFMYPTNSHVETPPKRWDQEIRLWKVIRLVDKNPLFLMELIFLQKEGSIQRIFISALCHVKTQREVAVCKPGREFLRDIRSVSAFVLNILVSRNVKKHVCCLSHPVCVYLLQQFKLRWDWDYYFHSIFY